MVEIGEKLKTLREENGYTQKEVADIFHLTPQTISKWELNKSYPDLDNLLALSQFYKISTDDLLGNTKESFFEALFSSKKERKGMLYKFYEKTKSPMFQIKLAKELNFDDYPELQKLGMWRRKLGAEWEVVITVKSPVREMEEVAKLFQVITNLKREEFEIKQIYQPFSFGGV